MVSASAVSRRSQPLQSSSRYELLVKIASGGMATVYVGRLTGSVGFSRFVAIKRAHPHLVDDPEYRRMLVEEATLASRIHHANVVAIQDVEHADEELLLVMDYVEGGSLAELFAAAVIQARSFPPGIGLRIALDACAGLHAVHELTGEDGRSYGLVHRDVSPQNLLVGVDGTTRLADFGVAKLTGVTSATAGGVLKGKTGYLAPEYIRGSVYTPRSDLFALGVVVWEALTGRRLFRGHNEADTLLRVVSEAAPPPSSVVPELGAEIDHIVGRALEKDPDLRQPSVLDFAATLEAAARRRDLLATHAEVGALVRELIHGKLAQRREQLRAYQDASSGDAIAAVSSSPKASPRCISQEPIESEEPTPRMSAAPDQQPPPTKRSSASLPRVVPMDDVDARPSMRPTLGATEVPARSVRKLRLSIAVLSALALAAVAWSFRMRDTALTGPADESVSPLAPRGAAVDPGAASPAAPASADRHAATLDGGEARLGAPRDPSTGGAATRPAGASSKAATAPSPTRSRPPPVSIPPNPYKARLKAAP